MLRARQRPSQCYLTATEHWRSANAWFAEHGDGGEHLRSGMEVEMQVRDLLIDFCSHHSNSGHIQIVNVVQGRKQRTRFKREIGRGDIPQRLLVPRPRVSSTSVAARTHNISSHDGPRQGHPNCHLCGPTTDVIVWKRRQCVHPRLAWS